MKRSTCHKFVSSFVLLGLLAQQAFFVFPERAEAQFQASTGIGAFFGGDLDIGGLGATVISCAFPNGIGNAISGLFNGGGAGDQPTGGDTGNTSDSDSALDTSSFSSFSSMGGISNTVPVTDQGAIDAIETTDENLTAGKDKQKGDKDNETNGQVDQGLPSGQSDGGIGGYTGFLTGGQGGKKTTGVLVDIRGEEQKDTKKERCFDKIARYMAVKMLDKITLATVEWINSGFEGQPLYLSEPDTFFSNIATEEINLVTGTLTDPQNITQYPFGRQVMESILGSLQQTFYQNAQFSLNQVLAHGTYEEFSLDFSVGGWAGYTALFEPANNPFGSYLQTQDHLSRQISGTSISAGFNFQQQLSQSGGFLNQRECVVSGTGQADYIAPNGDMADYYVPSGGPIPQAVYTAAGYDPNSNTPQTQQQAAIIDGYVLRSQCAQWKTVTPGYVAADQITTALNIPTNEILTVDELNESIGLIFDALLAQLVEQGLESLSGGDASTNVALAQVQGYTPGSTSAGIEEPVTTGDIITGGAIDYSLSQIQGYYIDNIAVATPLLSQLVLKIRSLDYCVPGPNPNWILYSEDALVDLIASTPVFLAQPEDSDNSGSIEQDEVDDANDENEAHYADLIEQITGVSIVEGPNMDRFDEFVLFMENLFNAYADRMQEDFSLTQPPPSARVLLAGLFNDLAQYENDIAFMNDYLANIGQILPILSGIEAELADLQAQNGGVLDESDPAVQAQLSLYNQISDQIVSEDDLNDLVAAIDMYNAEIPVLDTQVANCITQTDVGYPYSRQRVSYPFPYAAYPGMPNPNTNGFLPGVSLGNGNNGSIDVSFGGVQISGNSSGLSTFETTLENVY